MGLDHSGNESHPSGSPSWIVRVYGTNSELDTLASKPQVTEYSSVPDSTLDKMFAQNRESNGWNSGFQVGDEG